MKRHFQLALVTLFLAAHLTHAQQSNSTSRYHAKLIALDKVYEGDIDLNLYGENPPLINMQWSDISPDSTKKVVHRVQYDIEAVVSFVINQDTFYVKNLIDDENKIRANHLVKKVYGNDMLALYQFTSQDGQQRTYIGLPRHDPYYVQHPYFTSGSNMYTAVVYFKDCENLYQKIKSEQDGYWFKKGATSDQCVSVWKKIIDEYTNCKK